MTTISKVWDSTTEVLAGRLGMIAPVALGAIFLPGLVSAAHTAYGASQSPGFAVASLAIALVTLVLAIWGQLAILAIATHPDTTAAQARSQATARVLPAIGVTLAIVIGFVLLLVPMMLAIAFSGIDLTALAAATPTTMPRMPAGTNTFIVLYTLALVVVGLIVTARLLLVNVVVLNERRGLGAIGRSIVLTRGLTLKLIGVALLFAVVLMVSTLAAQTVSGLIFRLILGAGNAATAIFLAAVVGSLVSTGFTVLGYVFTARLYVATSTPLGRPDTMVAE